MANKSLENLWNDIPQDFPPCVLTVPSPIEQRDLKNEFFYEEDQQ